MKTKAINVNGLRLKAVPAVGGRVLIWPAVSAKRVERDVKKRRAKFVGTVKYFFGSIGGEK